MNAIEWCDNELGRALDASLKDRCRNVFDGFYLYGRRGELRIAMEKPNGFELVGGGMFRSGTRQQLFNYLRPFVFKFPCLPVDFDSKGDL
jgi:hypothetical protein